jgi:tRNA-dihydrouridine synthase
MRKHLGWYARGVPGAHGLRQEVVHTYSADEVAAILARYFAYRRGWEHSAPQISII